MTVQEHPNGDEFRPVRAASDALNAHLTSAIAELSTPPTEKLAMSTSPAGSFVASIRAMMDEARAGVAQARTDGLAKVQDAVGKLNEAKTATAVVTDSMAKTIEDEAASVMAELGQISNDLTGASGV